MDKWKGTIKPLRCISGFIVQETPIHGRNMSLSLSSHTIPTCTHPQNVPLFDIILWYVPKPLPEMQAQTNVVEVEKHMEDLLRMRKEALATHELARQTM
jgi:hypothetical protein